MTLDPISLTPVPSSQTEGEPVYAPMPVQESPLDTDAGPAQIPNLGHAALFFGLILPLLVAGQALSLFLLKASGLFGTTSYGALFSRMTSDARLAIPAQAVTYLLIVLASMLVFSYLWQQPFLDGIHWNAQVARQDVLRLFGLGLALGCGITLVGNYLPMPKDPPIMHDMMRSPLGAWMLLAFGITFAPLLEEIAFRGFLLPGLMHAFRWLLHREILSPEALSWATVPFSMLLTTVPFALMHAAQVSHAWAPLLLIGIVSLVLCIVRLRLHSVAASTIVHASYNFALFAGLLLQTDGFRHLDRLNS